LQHCPAEPFGGSCAAYLNVHKADLADIKSPFLLSSLNPNAAHGRDMPPTHILLSSSNENVYNMSTPAFNNSTAGIGASCGSRHVSPALYILLLSENPMAHFLRLAHFER
jgi:hypothetical protein